MGRRGARRRQAARYALGAASILALGTHSSHALAQSANDQAGRLFEDARKLMSEGRFADACPLLAQSDLLDPAVGTKMNLAKCYESLGRTASAWRVWGEAINALTLQHRTAADEAEQRKNADREAYARAHLETLGAHLPRLTLHLPPGVSKITILLDGENVPGDSASAELPVDPGTHALEARAPGRRGWSATFEVDGQRIPSVTLEVPALDPLPDAPVAPASPVSAPPGATEPSPWSRPVRTAAILSATGGAAALVAGAVWGVDAIRARNRALPNCTPALYCNEAGLQSLSDAKSDGQLADVAFGAGAAALIAAAVLWFAFPAPGSPSSWQSPLLRPEIARGGASLSFGRQW